MSTFNKITKGLRKTITQLERLVETNTTRVSGLGNDIHGLYEQITGHNASIRDLNTESSRANETAGKLRELIGEPVA